MTAVVAVGAVKAVGLSATRRLGGRSKTRENGGTMSRSFFTGTDAQLYAGSRVFAAKLSAEWAELGVPESMAIEYAELNAVYAASYRLALAPATRTKGTVIAKHDAAIPLRRLASRLAKIIDAAGAADARKVDLGLSVRAKRSPMAPPGKPDDFRVTLWVDGSIELRWKCANPVGAHGTMYQVSRRIGDGPLAYLASSGKKKFRDATIPEGASRLTYQVQAVRSTAVGPVAEYVVNFGGTFAPPAAEFKAAA
jgi:hypothetical protein